MERKVIMNGIINKNLDYEKARSMFQNTEPFCHLVVDDFFEDDLLNAVSENFPDIESTNWFRFRDKIGDYKNIFESGMNAISKPEKMPPTCRSFLYILNSIEFCKVLERLTGIKNIQPDTHWHYTGLRVNTPGSHQLIHSDALFHPHLKKRKILTCMVYLTKNWKKDDEGCLEFWDDNMGKCFHEVSPVFNRVAIFENTDKSYHGVTTNNHYRKAITMSYLLDDNIENRWRALFVKRPQDKVIKNFDKIAYERANLNDTK